MKMSIVVGIMVAILYTPTALATDGQKVPAGLTYTLRDPKGGIKTYGPGSPLPAGKLTTLPCSTLPYNPTKTIKGVKCFTIAR